MLRSVLVGLLAVSAAASCTKSEAPAAQPGTTAGNVVEVVGQVSALRGKELRPLAKGATVSADDVIQTGADSRIAIVLTHNNARWELAANVSKRVSESVAWGLARQDKPPEVVEQATSAAGRDHEKAGAQTAVTAGGEAAAPMQAAHDDPKGDKAPDAKQPAASPPPAAQPAANRPAPKPETEESSRDDRKAAVSVKKTEGMRIGGKIGDKGGGGRGRPMDTMDNLGGDLGGDRPGGGATATSNAPKPSKSARPDGKAALRALLASERTALMSCLGAAPKLTLTLHVANGKATFELSGGTATEKMRVCFDGVVTKLKLPAADGDVSIELVK